MAKICHKSKPAKYFERFFNYFLKYILHNAAILQKNDRINSRHYIITAPIRPDNSALNNQISAKCQFMIFSVSELQVEADLPGLRIQVVGAGAEVVEKTEREAGVDKVTVLPGVSGESRNQKI